MVSRRLHPVKRRMIQNDDRTDNIMNPPPTISIQNFNDKLPNENILFLGPRSNFWALTEGQKSNLGKCELYRVSWTAYSYSGISVIRPSRDSKIWT